MSLGLALHIPTLHFCVQDSHFQSKPTGRNILPNYIYKLLALAFSSAFSAGLLVTSVVFVESWRQLEPAASIDWFSIYGLLLGYVMVPMGALALVFTLFAFFSVVRREKQFSQKTVWLFALICTVGMMLLLPIYFGEANTRFFENTIALSEVAEEVERWAFWNWVRTGFSLSATMLIMIGLVRKPPKNND